MAGVSWDWAIAGLMLTRAPVATRHEIAYGIDFNLNVMNNFSSGLS
jgi:hypothetical protein